MYASLPVLHMCKVVWRMALNSLDSHSSCRRWSNIIATKTQHCPEISAAALTPTTPSLPNTEWDIMTSSALIFRWPSHHIKHSDRPDFRMLSHFYVGRNSDAESIFHFSFLLLFAWQIPNFSQKPLQTRQLNDLRAYLLRASTAVDSIFSSLSVSDCQIGLVYALVLV